MKRDLLKRALVMVLVMLVATAGLPMDAFASANVEDQPDITIGGGGHTIEFKIPSRANVVITFPDGEHDKLSVSGSNTFTVNAPVTTKMIATFIDFQDQGMEFNAIKLQYQGQNGQKIEHPRSMRLEFGVAYDANDENSIIDYITSWKSNGSVEIVTPEVFISPDSQNFVDSFDAVLSSDDENADIFYKLDDDAFRPYTGEISIDSSTSVTAYAIDEAGNHSLEKTVNYTKVEVPDFESTLQAKGEDVSEGSSIKPTDVLNVEATELDAEWDVIYKWYKIVYNLETEEWEKEYLDVIGDSYTPSDNYGQKIGVDIDLVNDGTVYNSINHGDINIHNLFITVDDKHDFFINGDVFSMSSETTHDVKTPQHDGSWSTVDTYYLSPEDYSKVPLFAVKGWDGGEGTHTISGFRLAYFGPNGNDEYDWLSTGKDKWYEWHEVLDVNDSNYGISILPTEYRNYPWYTDMYKGDWDQALTTATEAGGWSSTSAKFPVESGSDWVWSEYYLRGQVVGEVTVNRFNSPVFFRNEISKDLAPELEVTNITVVQGTDDVMLNDFITYSDDVDSNADLVLTYDIIDGTLRLNGGEIDTNQSGVSHMTYTVTDKSGLMYQATIFKVIMIDWYYWLRCKL